MTGVANVQKINKLNGKGVKIAIIDNGVDYTHPALGGCFGPGCKISFGFDLVGSGDVFDPLPDNDPLETCNGHGTHITGIIAAEDNVYNFTGIAPKATIGMYRINACNDATTDDLILKALELAEEDNVDVINLSIGTPFASWSETPISIACTQLANKGIKIIVAAPNNGATGLFTMGSPDSAINVITVGSVENTKFLSYYLLTSCCPDRKIAYTTTQITLRYDVPVNAPLRLVLSNNSPNPENDACSPLQGDFSGSYVLIRRGGCLFSQKNLNAEAAGALGVIFYNNETTQTFALDVSGTNIPSAFISRDDGIFLVGLILDPNNNGRSITISFPNDTIAVENLVRGLPSVTSSWGPTFEMDLKPDILAPGGRIFSTYLTSLGSYATLSGTSMAAAYASGVTALYLQDLKNKGISALSTNPEQIRDIFTYTSTPIEMEDFDMPYSTAKQGGGVINIKNAIKTTTLISPGKFALNDTVHANNTQSFTITNVGKQIVTYKMSHIPAVSVRGFADNVLVSQANLVYDPFSSKVEFSKKEIKLRPRQSEKITIKITPPSQLKNKDLGLFSGYIGVEDTTTKFLYTLPYLGLKGDIRDIPVLSPKPGQPFVATFNGDHPQTSQDESAVFTFANLFEDNSDSPSLYYTLGFGSRRVRVTLINLQGEVVAVIYEATFLGRNGDGVVGYEQHIFDWFGFIGENFDFVPNGSYRFELRILKTYGNFNNDRDVITWISPIIIVAA
ncbi:7641_t:CDS:2 [Diversispora eburnea]|uniref:7641_t:CDS:1 n=1 Tax=Diversispora eburnea TaxID=1213867 RepID=A0A9N9ANW4_9GLOM|nr:7641_t:CDS:2 [Diversispora eburnea]